MSSLTLQFTKTTIRVASAMLFAAAVAAAQCNTGYTGGPCGTLVPPSGLGAQLAGTTTDGNWQLATPYPSSPTNPSTGTTQQQNLIKDPCSSTLTKYGPAWVSLPDGQAPGLVYYGYWSTDGPTSNWISPKNEVIEPDGLFIYKTTYTPTASGAIRISGRIQSDNETFSIYGSSPAQAGRCQHLAGNQYNGSYSGPLVNGPAAFLTWTPFLTSPFSVVGGSPATLYFVVRNRQTSWGATTPAGLRVQFGKSTGKNFTVGSGGDLNGDGLTDVVVADNGTNTVSVYLNQKGNFPKATEYPVGTDPVSVTVGDLNADGKPDLAVANFGSGTVSILINNGDGTFRKQVPYASGENPTAVAIGDVNGDGVEDLVLTNANGTVSILMGTGGGAFQPAQTVAVGDPLETTPMSPVLADLDGDGHLDLALADMGTGSVIILLGNGNGTFQSPITIATPAIGPDRLVVRDFNSDGIPDLAISDAGTGMVYVLFGTGSGSFQSPVGYDAGSNPQSLTVYGDAGSTANLAVVDPASNVVTTLLSSGAGTFKPGSSYPAGNLPLSIVPLTTSTGVTLAVIDNGTSSITKVKLP